MNDARNARAMNMATDNWHGDRVNIYQQGYQQGYDSVKGYGPGAAIAPGAAAAPVYNPGTLTGDDQRAYQAGYQNGLTDARNNRAMNPVTELARRPPDDVPAGLSGGYRSAGGPIH